MNEWMRETVIFLVKITPANKYYWLICIICDNLAHRKQKILSRICIIEKSSNTTVKILMKELSTARVETKQKKKTQIYARWSLATIWFYIPSDRVSFTTKTALRILLLHFNISFSSLSFLLLFIVVIIIISFLRILLAIFSSLSLLSLVNFNKKQPYIGHEYVNSQRRFNISRVKKNLHNKTVVHSFFLQISFQTF